MNIPTTAVLVGLGASVVSALAIFSNTSIFSLVNAEEESAAGSQLQTGKGFSIVRDPVTGRISIARNLYSDGFNVGVGTSTPQATLDVRGPVQVDSSLGGLELRNSQTEAVWRIHTGNALHASPTSNHDLVIDFTDPAGADTNPVLVIDPAVKLVLTCPFSGNFVSVESASNQLGCIQFDEEPLVTSWERATQTCFEKYGGKLPSTGEWRIAVLNYDLANEADDEEWNDDAYYKVDFEPYSNEKFHFVSCASSTGDRCDVDGDRFTHDVRFDVDAKAFRCWIPR